jgi:hypothetical protein
MSNTMDFSKVQGKITGLAQAVVRLLLSNPSFVNQVWELIQPKVDAYIAQQVRNAPNPTGGVGSKR